MKCNRNVRPARDDGRGCARRGERGFTLIELLASTLLLIVGMLFFAGLFGSSLASIVQIERARIGKTYAETGMGDFASRARLKYGDPQNLALGHAATQSSTGNWGQPAVASLAVDGNTDGNYWDYSVAHTLADNQAWWQVDLGAAQQIRTISIWNRTDCCGERLSDFYVFVSDQQFVSTNVAQTIYQPGVSNYHTAGTAGPVTTINVNRTGRYVRVQLGGSNNLQLAEVQVIGYPLSGAGQQGIPDGGTTDPGAQCTYPYCDQVWQAPRQSSVLPPPTVLPPTSRPVAGSNLLFVRRFKVETIDAATGVRQVTMTLATTESEQPFLTRRTRIFTNK